MIIETKWELSFSVFISLLALAITLIRWFVDIYKSREHFSISIPSNKFINSIKFGKRSEQLPSDNGTIATAYKVTAFCSFSITINNLSKAPLTINAISFKIDDNRIWCEQDSTYFKTIVYSKSLLDEFEHNYEYKDGEISESTINSSEFPLTIQANCSSKIRIKFRFTTSEPTNITDMYIHTPRKVYSSNKRKDLNTVLETFKTVYLDK